MFQYSNLKRFSEKVICNLQKSALFCWFVWIDDHIFFNQDVAELLWDFETKQVKSAVEVPLFLVWFQRNKLKCHGKLKPIDNVRQHIYDTNYNTNNPLDIYVMKYSRTSN